MRKLGKKIGKDHKMARRLFKHGYRETMIIASMVAEPEKLWMTKRPGGLPGMF